jgi:hypothetical protein
MRSLLLGTTIGKIYWVKGIQHIWPLLLEGIFIAIAVVEQSAYGQEQIWKLVYCAKRVLVARNPSLEVSD